MTSAQDSIESLHEVLTVEATPEATWRVFTAQIGRWWPLAGHEIGAGAGITRVELEHRPLDLFAARAQEMRRVFVSEGGWSFLLQAHALCAAASESTTRIEPVSP